MLGKCVRSQTLLSLSLWGHWAQPWGGVGCSPSPRLAVLCRGPWKHPQVLPALFDYGHDPGPGSWLSGAVSRGQGMVPGALCVCGRSFVILSALSPPTRASYGLHSSFTVIVLLSLCQGLVSLMLWVAEWMSLLARAVPKLSLSLPFPTSRAALTDLCVSFSAEPTAPTVQAG